MGACTRSKQSSGISLQTLQKGTHVLVGPSFQRKQAQAKAQRSMRPGPDEDGPAEGGQRDHAPGSRSTNEKDDDSQIWWLQRRVCLFGALGNMPRGQARG